MNAASRSLRALAFCALIGLSFGAAAAPVDLTRYLLRLDGDFARTRQDSFAAVPGGAVLSFEGPADGVTVTLNGRTVPAGEVTLQADNAIAIHRDATAQLRVRITQRADVTLNVLSRIHFNTNVSDFAAARAFYGALGFETLSGFPDANTVAMAQAIGIAEPTGYDGSKGGEPGGYLLHGELIGLGFNRGTIDLIEFSMPRNDAPPYPALNRLGMARAVLETGDIDSDYAVLTEKGVRFLSAPVARADGTRFAILRDPDGTFYELRHVDGDVADEAPTHVHRAGAVVINVSDLQRSLAWYRMLGYEPTGDLTPRESRAVAVAMGFAAPFEIRGATLTHQEDGSKIELVEWVQPFDPTPPYPAPINHLGIHRMAFTTGDIEGDMAQLMAQGVETISPITPCCSGADSWGNIVAFYDPDGTILELAEMPLMTWIQRLMNVFN